MSPAETNKKIVKPSFVSRYMVTLVMIPAIIAMHYGWVLLQDNRSLVSEKEKIELPVVTAAKYLWHKVKGTVPEKEPATK